MSGKPLISLIVNIPAIETTGRVVPPCQRQAAKAVCPAIFEKVQG